MPIRIGEEPIEACKQSGNLNPAFSHALLRCVEEASVFNAWVKQRLEQPDHLFPSQWDSMRDPMPSMARGAAGQAGAAIKPGGELCG